MGSTYLRQAINHMRNKVNETLSGLRKDYHSKKLEEHKNDLKGTWKVLKHAMGQGSKTTNVDKTKVKYKGNIYKDVDHLKLICQLNYSKPN